MIEEPAARPDEARLGEFMSHALDDLGAAVGAALVVIGDKLGLYKTMAAARLVPPHSRSAPVWPNAMFANG
jgi:hypothetical protein